jgi:2-polyprenyl-3-methyl-5-hydroxy-6-metoxy-1,4-benzoquinol methylase
LEVGCSYGWFLDLCTKNKINCIGIEPETRFNDYYIEKGHQVINGFYPAALDEKEKFDFIIFNDVLEHIPDINNVIIANHKFLKTEGLIIVNIPIQSGLFYRIAVLCYHIGIKSFLNRMWQFDFHSPHLYYFTKKNLKNIFRGKGFECIEIKPMQVIDASQMKNRIAEDQSIGKAKLWFFTFWSYLITPFTKFKPDIFCFFFKKL